MRLSPRGEFLQEELDNAHIGIRSTTTSHPPPPNPTGKGKGRRSLAVLTEEILVFSSFLGFRSAKMPGLQDRVGGRRKGRGGGRGKLCGGKSQEIKGQRSCCSAEGTKAINQQRGGKGASPCPLEKRLQDPGGGVVKPREEPMREVVPSPGALTGNRAELGAQISRWRS